MYVRDPIELGAKLEGMERVEVGVLRDLSLSDGQERIEQTNRHARQASETRGHFEKVRHRLPQHEHRSLGRVLRQGLAEQPRARSIVGKHALEVTLKHEGALALGQEDPANLDDSAQSFPHERRVLAEILGDDGGLAGRPRMIARVGEASEPFEQNLELE